MTQNIDFSRVFALLKTWCDALAAHRINMPDIKAAHGGLFCPACASLHGRIADAVYPLTYMYKISKNPKYLECARSVVGWCENNVLQNDGSYANDKNSNRWVSTTAFCQIAFGNVLTKLKDILDEATYEKWFDIFKRQTTQIYNYFRRPDFSSAINYPIQFCHCMAMAYKILGDEIYKKAAYERYKSLRKYFTQGGLIFGEGNADIVTENGSRCIDVGYNVEESLCALIGFADIMNDRQIIIELSKMMRAHLEFMLPDGAWDGSWSSRSYKWTYYGSRTSDGAQSGLLTLAVHTGDIMFEKAALKNFELYEKCTGADGLLAGGPMYKDANEDTCIHHTFCHAKALCELCEYLENNSITDMSAQLPRETEYGTKYISDANTALVSYGKWRATVSNNDYRYKGNAIGGGSLSLLWNEDIGAVLVKSMSVYNPIEPNNMQFQRNSHAELCMTPRVVLFGENHNIVTGKNVYSSDNAVNATMNIGENPLKQPIISVDGVLRSIDGNALPDGNYRITYSFDKKGNSTSIKVSTVIGGMFSLPIVASSTDEVKSCGKSVTIRRNGKTIEVSASKDIEFGHSEKGELYSYTFENLYRGSDVNRRAFCTVGGFMYVPLVIRLDAGKSAYLRITIID